MNMEGILMQYPPLELQPLQNVGGFDMSFDDLRLDVPIGWKDFMYYLTKPQWGKLRKGIRVEDVIPIQKNQAFIREAFSSFTDEDFKKCIEYWKVNQDSKPRPPKCPEETWYQLDAFIREEPKCGITKVKRQFPDIAWGDMTREQEFIWFMYCRKCSDRQHAANNREKKRDLTNILLRTIRDQADQIEQLQADNEQLREYLQEQLRAATALAGLCKKHDIKPKRLNR